jgi:hypothetical protein
MRASTFVGAPWYAGTFAQTTSIRFYLTIRYFFVGFLRGVGAVGLVIRLERQDHANPGHHRRASVLGD